MKKEDALIDGDDTFLSLNKLTQRKVVDVTGWVSYEFGDPVFRVSNIVLDDGTKLSMGGAHDCSFIDGAGPGLSEDELREVDPEEEDEEGEDNE